MKRRKFVASTALAASAGLASAKTMEDPHQDAQNEIYDLKTYELTFGADQSALENYLREVLKPALTALGAKEMMIFSEYGESEPRKLWTLTVFPNFEVFQKAIALSDQETFIRKAASYAGAGQVYNRISSSLLYAFDGLKQMPRPIDGADLFELRIYEGVNEDAVRRKIRMFNQEEIDLFYRTDLIPLFFGKMLTGPYEPSLVYMLNFRDMEHRNQAWGKFINHPNWLVMRDKEEYRDSVSNIRKVFLKLA